MLLLILLENNNIIFKSLALKVVWLLCLEWPLNGLGNP